MTNYRMLKRILIVIVLLCSSNSLIMAQSNDEGKHELRADLLNSILGSFEVQYERILTDHISVGTNIGIGYPYIPNQGNIFKIIPTYRIYFSEYKATGLFIESNMKYTYDYKWNKDGLRKEKESNLGFGVAMGYKLIVHDKMVGSVKTGIGRYIRERDSVGFLNGNNYWGNFEISLGRRF